MPNEAIDLIVFTDSQGNYYALPRQALEQARVPEEHKAEIERLTRQGEVVGYEAMGGSGLHQVGSISVSSGLTVSNLQLAWSAE